MAKYSIILPIYKVENYLEECVNSVLAQKFKDYELILVDDGSPDNCPKMCDEFAKNNSRVKVVHEKNSGIANARNRGIKIAKGKYILFIDPDDYVEENYLEVIDKSIEDFDMIIFGFYNLYKNKKVIQYGKNETLTRDKALEYLVSDNKIRGYVWNKVFKKRLIEENHLLFDSNMTVSEDTWFVYNCLKKVNNIKTIDTPLYYYRQRKSSLMSRKLKDINPKSFFDMYYYIYNDNDNPAIREKCKVRYLKNYYKYRNYIPCGVVNDAFLQDLIKNEYKFFSKHDRRAIMTFKYGYPLRPFAFAIKNRKDRKFD